MKDKNPYLEQKDVLESKDYKCPNCGAWPINGGENSTFKEQTEPEFMENPDPYLAWFELHQCYKCETNYTFRNST